MATVEVPALSWKTIILPIEGVTPLLQDRLSPEAVEQIETGKRNDLEPVEEAANGLYFFEQTEGEYVYGHPATAFKSAIVEAARNTSRDMTEVKQMQDVLPDFEDLVRIEHSQKWELDRRVATPNNATMVANRARIPDGWEATLQVTYDVEAWKNIDELIRHIQIAGQAVGVGSYRIQNDGPFGRFQIVCDEATIEDVE